MESTRIDKEDRFVVFTLGGQQYALGLADVSEVVPLPLLSRPPALPAVVEGMLNLRGVRIPVIRLERVFGLACAELETRQHIVIVTRRGQSFGVLVDYVREIRRIAGEPLDLGQPLRLFNDCIVAEITLDQAPLFILTVDGLFQRLEQRDAQAA